MGLGRNGHWLWARLCWLACRCKWSENCGRTWRNHNAPMWMTEHHSSQAHSFQPRPDSRSYDPSSSVVENWSAQWSIACLKLGEIRHEGLSYMLLGVLATLNKNTVGLKECSHQIESCFFGDSGEERIKLTFPFHTWCSGHRTSDVTTRAVNGDF